MFHGAITRQPTEDGRPRFPLHNLQEDHNRYRNAIGLSESPESDTLAENTPQDGLASRSDGTWGERDIGGPVSHMVALQDYETLRRELTNLSRTRSRSRSQPRRKPAPVTRALSGRSLGRLSRTLSSQRSGAEVEDEVSSTTDNVGDETQEQAEGENKGEEEEDFALDQFMREGHFEKRVDNRSAKRVGVVYKNLTVKGVGSTAVFVKTLPSAVLGTFGPDLYKIACRFMPFLAFGRKGTTRTLINDFTGLVRDGEMMLVLGRPVSVVCTQ